MRKLWILSLSLWAATSSLAEPHLVRFQNTDLDRSAVEARLCLDSGECFAVPADCGPGAFCKVVVDLPAGFWVATLEVAAEPGVWSDPSPTAQVTAWRAGWVPTMACRADFDGNGAVTVTDFSRFLESFGATCDSPMAPAP